MKAKYVYEENKRDIKIISDAMRKEGRPGHIEGGGRMKGLMIGSAQPFEPDIDILDPQVVGMEIAGIHTFCQVKPVGMRDLELLCVQTEDGKEKYLRDCVDPIAKDVMIELANISIEQEKTVIDLIKRVRSGQITDEEAAVEMKSRLAKSYRDEQEIIKYYDNFKKTHCGKIVKTLTKIETKGAKVIETETRTTRETRL